MFRALGFCALGAAIASMTIVAAGLAVPAQSAEGDDAGKLMLVLDSSGSMKERSGGTTKIAAAKIALKTVIDNLPAEQSVGLRVYGAEVFSADDEGACTDSQLAVELGTNNRSELTNAVAAYKPYGETPTGYALQQAGKDLGTEGTRTIVLVSDGESTCSPDPCKVAATLAKSGISLRIDVIGLNVSGKARSQLQCIAGSGNGSYYDATDADDLVQALDTLATRSARPYESIGRAITGSQVPAKAPSIGPGDWRDTLGGAGSDKRELFYALSDFDPRSTLHISASINQPLGDKDQISLQVVRAANVEKSSEHCVNSSAQEIGARQVGLLSASVSWQYDTEDPQPECKPDDLLIRVRRGWDSVAEEYSGGGNNDLPVEIRVIEEPAIVAGQPLPNRIDDAIFQLPGPTSERSPLVGGSSFGNAPTITPGAYSDTVVPGETQIFLVDVRWGQSLQAQLSVPDVTGALDKEVGSLGPLIEVAIYSPARAKASTLIPYDSGGELTSTRVRIGEDASEPARVMTAPIRYNNREFLNGSSVSNDTAAAISGKYAIVIHTDPSSRSNVSYQVPVTLDVAVTGEVSGEPDYLYEPTKTDTTAPVADQSRDSSASTGLPALPIALGVLLVFLLSGAFVALRRLRSN